MNTPLYEKIINKGHYEIVAAYSQKQRFINLIEDSLFDLIKEIVGTDVYTNLKQCGLTSMHKFVNPDLINIIQDRLSEHIKLDMLDITNLFSKEILGLNSEFYQDLMVISRIKFPFEIARTSRVSYADYNTHRGRISFAKPPELTSGYHHNLPFPAWAHGPHADSWFGHSYDGINLWWAYDGVNSKSGMTFYPEFVGDDSLPVHDEPPYLTKDYPLSMPVFFDLNKGDVIAFNSETLHGTRLNHSDLTRISISTRINPARPRFGRDQFRHVKLWVKSSNMAAFLEAGKTNALPTVEASHNIHKDVKSGNELDKLIFIAKKEDFGNSQGKLGNTCEKSLNLPVKIVDNRLASDDLKLGEKVQLNIKKRKVIIARTTKGLFAVSGICPHVGYNLIAGAHDDNELVCSGHGVAYKWKDGKSECSNYKLTSFLVWESNGNIVYEV